MVVIMNYSIVDNNLSFTHYPDNSHTMYSYESVSKDKMVNVAFYQNIYTTIF